jgi:hypothetical protein
MKGWVSTLAFFCLLAFSENLDKLSFQKMQKKGATLLYCYLVMKIPMKVWTIVHFKRV